MTAPIRSLIIKEYHEQKWRCASLCAIGLSVILFTLIFEPSEADVVSLWLTIAFSLVGALFIAMGVAAGERAGGTLELLRSLPVRLYKAAAIRLLLGAAAWLIPIVLVLGIYTIWILIIFQLSRMGYEIDKSWLKLDSDIGGVDKQEMLGLTIASICIGCNVYLWTVAVGLRQRTELRAGLWGIGVIISLAILPFVLNWLMKRVADGLINRSIDAYHSMHQTNEQLTSVLVASSPIGPIFTLDNHFATIHLIVGSQIAVGTLLVTYIMLRYASMSRLDNLSPSTKTKHAPQYHLTEPRHSPFTAIVWKQWRDTLPVLLLALLLLTVFVVIHATGDYRPGIDQPLWRLVIWVEESSTMIGVVFAVVVGVGAFVGDYQPAMLTFWRSRPISPRLWFWSKYFVGLAIVELTMMLPWVIAQLLAGNAEHLSGDAYLGIMPALYFFIYSVSVWMACLLRHTIYAGIITGGIVVTVVLLPVVESKLHWLSVGHALAEARGGNGWTRWLSQDFLPPFTLMILLAAIALFLATRAAKRDSAFAFER